MSRVHIEFQHLLAWLFTEPLLRAIVSANALLGETPSVVVRSATWKFRVPVSPTATHP
jgi:hypothetical protein